MEYTYRRYLSWYLDGAAHVGATQGPTYRLEQLYTPVAAYLQSRQAATATNVGTPGWTEVDILVNGVSVFDSTFLILIPGTTMDDQDSFLGGTVLELNDLITVDVRRVASGESGRDLTIELVLETY